MKYIRLNKSANLLNEVLSYYQDRARQIIFDDFFWTKEAEEIIVDNKPVAVKTSFIKDSKKYYSYYIYRDARGKGIYESIVQKNETIVTVSDCKLVDYFKNKNIDYVVAATPEELYQPEYNLISEAYGNTLANRSKQPYMNHIDEGAYILKQINASEDTIRSYFVHPIFQPDENLDGLGRTTAGLLSNTNVLMLAMEYRNIANAYLSFREIQNISEFKLSPLKEVNDMLIADKIQNYKDFVLYHLFNHSRANELNDYFHNWFLKLNLESEFIEHIIKNLESIELKTLKYK